MYSAVPSTTEHSIFSLLKSPPDVGAGSRAAPQGRWLVLLALAAAAWVGGVAYLGRYRHTQVSRALWSAVPDVVTVWGWKAGPGEILFWSAAGLTAALLAFGLIRRDRALAGVAAMVLAYLLGFAVLDGLPITTYVRHRIPFQRLSDGLTFARNRLVYLVPTAALMLAVRYTFFRGSDLFHFGWGDWRVESKDVSVRSRMQSYTRIMFPGYAIYFFVPFTVVMLATVGFKPVLSGTLWPLLPAVLIAALVNATVEEIIYRGLIQPAFIAYAGTAAGLWMQGLLFGIIHWGLSVGVLAALPVSLLIGLGSVVWGKAALETRGLGWVIAAHFLIDVGVMAAYFAPGR